MIELACPDTCQYLRAAREQAVARESELPLKDLDPGEARLLAGAGIDQRLIPLIYAIDRAIVTAQRETYRDLQDAEVLAAVENAIKNIETESSGLIYEHRTSSLRIQAVSEKIRSSLEELAGHESLAGLLTRSDKMAALKYVRLRVSLHVRNEDKNPAAARGFVRHIALFFPWPEDAAKPLII